MAIMFLEKKFVIHTTHTDFKDIIRPYAILDFFQDLAGIHAEQIGVGFEDIAKLGYIWVVLYEQYEVLQNLCKFGDEIIVLLRQIWIKEGTKAGECSHDLCAFSVLSAERGKARICIPRKVRFCRWGATRRCR